MGDAIKWFDSKDINSKSAVHVLMTGIMFTFWRNWPHNRIAAELAVLYARGRKSIMGPSMNSQSKFAIRLSKRFHVQLVRIWPQIRKICFWRGAEQLRRSRGRSRPSEVAIADPRSLVFLRSKKCALMRF
jgi:hypothetical protein